MWSLDQDNDMIQESLCSIQIRELTLHLNQASRGLGRPAKATSGLGSRWFSNIFSLPPPWEGARIKFSPPGILNCYPDPQKHKDADSTQVGLRASKALDIGFGHWPQGWQHQALLYYFLSGSVSVWKHRQAQSTVVKSELKQRTRETSPASTAL